MLDNSLYINTIRICIKAKKISFGETMLYDIRSNKAKVVVIALDAGEASKKKVKDKCKSFEVTCIELLSKQELSYLFNKDISGFAITDENLANKFIENLNKGGSCYGK